MNGGSVYPVVGRSLPPAPDDVPCHHEPTQVGKNGPRSHIHSETECIVGVKDGRIPSNLNNGMLENDDNRNQHPQQKNLPPAQPRQDEAGVFGVSHETPSFEVRK